MKLKRYLPLFGLVILILSFFIPPTIQGRLPIPADTIVGLYHPYRDLYAEQYPNGIPYKNFLVTDPVRQQYPWKELTVSVGKAGNLPSWNPYAFAGYPLLANVQSGAFYPLNMLLLLLPFSFGWTIYIWLQPILGGIFLYFYLRNLRISSLAAVLGGFVFAYSGFFVAWLEWGNILHTAVWLPLILLSIDKVFASTAANAKFKMQNSPLRVWLSVFILSLALSFFAGHLQTFFYSFVTVFLYLLMRWWQNGRQLRMLGLFSLCTLLFAIIVFPQWYPTMKFIGESARSIDQADWSQEGWFIPWQHLIQFIAPDFFGNPSTLNYFGVWNYGEFIGYIGIFPLLLSLYALIFRRDKDTWFFGGVIIFALLFALPTILAKIPFLLSLPFVSTAQPTRLLFLIDFSLAVLCAFGFDYFQKKEKNIIYLLCIFLGIFGIVWGIVLFSPAIIPGLMENISVAKRNLQLPTLLLFGVTMITIIILRSKNDQLKLLLLLGLLMITVADISRFAAKFTPFTKLEYLYPQTKALTFLQKNLGEYRYMALDSRIFPPNFSSVYKIQSIEGYDPLYLKRYAELIAASERKKPDISAPLGFHRIITPHDPDSPIINLLGVKYVLALTDISYPHLKKVSQEGQTRIYENSAALPRAFFVAEIQLERTGNNQKIMQFLFDQQHDLRRQAVVEGELPRSGFSSGSAEIEEFTANKVRIHTNNQSEGFLVFTDTFYPTWRANLLSTSGQTLKSLTIYRTDYNFRGVVVPPGEYIVEFSNSLF